MCSKFFKSTAFGPASLQTDYSCLNEFRKCHVVVISEIWVKGRRRYNIKHSIFSQYFSYTLLKKYSKLVSSLNLMPPPPSLFEQNKTLRTFRRPSQWKTWRKRSTKSRRSCQTPTKPWPALRKRSSSLLRLPLSTRATPRTVVQILGTLFLLSRVTSLWRASWMWVSPSLEQSTWEISAFCFKGAVQKCTHETTTKQKKDDIKHVLFFFFSGKLL